MAGLADDWEENRQAYVDVLCAYLRMPYIPGSGKQANQEQQLVYRASAGFSGGTVVFDRGDLSGSEAFCTHSEFTDGTVSFNHAKFCTRVGFHGAKFSGSRVGFNDAEFRDGTVDLGAEFSGGLVTFNRARSSLRRLVLISGAEFSSGVVTFNHTRLSGGRVDFFGANFSGGTIEFGYPADWSRPPDFPGKETWL